METMIGFIAGYLVGANDGPTGLARVRKSLEAIRTSPEVRRLAVEATGIAGAVLRQVSRRGVAGSVSDVTGILVSKAGTRGASGTA